MATKKSTEIATIPSLEVTTIPSKGELQAGMRKTLKELDDKLANLVGPTTRTYRMGNIAVRDGGLDGVFDLKTSSDLQLLIKGLAQLKRVKREHFEIIKDLDIKNVPCLIQGIDVDVWIGDIEYKIKSITNSSTIASIKAAKAKLESFLSEDDRLIKVLSEVETLLK